MTKLGKMRDLVNNIKGFSGDEGWYNPLLMSNT